MEGIRLAGTFGLYRQATAADVVQDGDQEVHVRPGDNIFVSFVRSPFLNSFPSPISFP